MNKLITIIFVLLSASAFGQITLPDSAQIVAYWSKGEAHKYKITEEKFNVHGTDSAITELSYDVDIKIVDSTATSYVMEWYYHNYNTTATDEMTKKLMTMADDMKILVETDENGVFKSVKNWMEISAFMKKAINKLIEDLPKEVADAVTAQVGDMFSSQSAIENYAINEVHQFLTFHGMKYKKGEALTDKTKIPSLFGADELDAKETYLLNEIDAKNYTVELIFKQDVDSKQLTKQVVNYIKSFAASMGKKLKDKDLDLSEISCDLVITSHVHEAGWVVSSEQTKITSIPGTKNYETVTIELQ
jgi:hypothetical protein